jgi:hypothetical protein
MSNNKGNKYSKKYKSYNTRDTEFDDMLDHAFGDEFFTDNLMFEGFGRFNSGGRGMIGSNFDQDIDSFGFGPNIMSNFISMQSGGNKGTVISKSYVSTVKYDQNGQPQMQEYSSQSIDQFTKDGKLSEKKQAFQDSVKGVKKASHQRILNDQGHKIVKTRDYTKNEEFEDHYYKGMNEGMLIEYLTICIVE